MRNTKKIIFSAGCLAIAAAPVIASISCGSSASKLGRYDTNNDNFVDIWSTFGVSGNQHKALKTVVDKYNEVNAATDQDVRIVTLDNGYAAQVPALQKAFEAQQKTEVPNLVVGYPDSLGIVSRYEMGLDFGVTTANSQYQYEDDHGINMNEIFDENFTAINGQIAGLKNNGSWVLPFGKSTDMLTENRPVLKHIITTMIAKGYTVASTGATMINAVKDDATVAAADTTFIASKFVPVSATSITGSDAFVLSDAIFTDFEAMLDFVIHASKVVTFGTDNYILGIDSITNLMYTYGYSLAQAQYANFYFNLNQNGYIDYKYGKANDTSWNNFTRIYNKIVDASVSKGLFVRDVQYSSDYSKTHSMAFSIGSTAGYDYNFIGNGYEVLAADSTEAAPKYVSQGAAASKITNVEYVNITGSGNDMGSGAPAGNGWKKGLVIEWQVEGTTNKNYMFTSDSPFTPKTASSGNPRYWQKSSLSSVELGTLLAKSFGLEGSTATDYAIDLTDSTQLAAFKAKAMESTSLMWMRDGRATATPASYPDFKLAKGNVPLTAGTFDVPTAPANGQHSGNYFGNEMYFLPSTSYASSGHKTLQSSEMKIHRTPSQYGATSAKTTLIQGPSIFGVHSNATQNSETRKFMNWLMTADVAWTTTGQNPVTTQMTPVLKFAADASYIVPTKTALTAAEGSGNAAQKLAFANLKAIQSDATEFGFDNPVDYTTGAAREYIASGIQNSWKAWYANGNRNGNMQTISQLYGTFKNLDTGKLVFKY